MKTRTILPLSSVVAAMFLAACSSSPSMEPLSEPIYLDLDDFELVSHDVLIGQEGIDFERAWIERDLERMLAEDPDHPDVEQIRKALADLERRERWFHWRVAHGFTNPDGTYIDGRTEEEFWRAVIESPEMLELTDEQLKAAEAHYLSILARDTVGRDTTVAASGSEGRGVYCTTDADLSSSAGGDMFYDEGDNLLRFNTLAITRTTSYAAGLGMVETPQRHRFTGMAEPDARSSNGDLTTYIPTSWSQENCVAEMWTPQNFVYTGTQPGARYCAGGSYSFPFGKAEKWSQQYLWDFSTWINYDWQAVAIQEDCATVPGHGGGGCEEEDDCPDPPNNEGCEWISGPGYGFWFCVYG